MAEGGVTRKLAAILAGDVVGFSRLMSADEVGTLAQVTAHLDEVVRPAVDAHQGHIFKTMGDGFLAEFASAVEAVECAVRIQRAMAERAGDVAEERRAIFRIGINLGDIIVQGDDVFGDGVNVAARIEALADPGGVFISSSVCDQIAGKCDFPLDDLGEHEVKNIPKPVHVFRVVTDPSAAPGKRIVPTRGKTRNRWLAGVAALAVLAVLGVAAVDWFRVSEWGTKVEPVAALSETPSIAVLPFNNLSGDKDQEYFSDGMTEDLITDLSKISGLFVIARNSSFQYRNRETEIGKVGRDLGVSHILTGSIRKSGKLIRISAQLIEVVSGKHIWAERYDRELSEVFAIQDEVTTKIVGALEINLTDQENLSLKRSYTISVEAYDELLKGRREFSRVIRAGNTASRTFFEKAIQLDPAFADAYAFLAWTYVRGYFFSWDDDPDSSLRLASKLARKALSLDQTKSMVYLVLGVVELYQRNHSAAVEALEKSIELNPNHANSYAMLAFILNYAGFPEKSGALIATGMRLNPHHSYMYFMVLGQGLFLMGRYDQASEVFTKAAARNPEDTQVLIWMAASKARAGRRDEAQWDISELLAQDGSITIENITSRLPFNNPEHMEKVADGLREAGLPH